MKPLTTDEQATNSATREHIAHVQRLLHAVVKQLLDRADAHDQSKLAPPEVSLFAEMTPKLAATTYGSPEYAACLDALKPALQHHYANNRHHPEHHPDGVNGMDLVDLIEMFCDWKAATLRHDDGDIAKSIQHNTTRFGLSPQLAQILKNSAKLFERRPDEL